MALAYIDYESTITYDEYNMVFVKPVLACTVFRSMVISAMCFIFRTNPSPMYPERVFANTKYWPAKCHMF